jgi:hypothetical protein
MFFRVTFSEDYNFIVRYMPGRVHEVAHTFWSTNLFPNALLRLTPPPHNSEIGCFGIGSTSKFDDYVICASQLTSISLPAYELGLRKKQPDDGIQPLFNPSGLPSIVVEVGSSESLNQLKIDARLWLEYSAEVSLVLYCHSLTRISSDKARHPYFNRPPPSPLPKFSNNHNSIMAEFSS